jgi:predicted dehydrogenase
MNPLDRRSFLIGAAALAPRAFAANDTIGTAMIGTGGRGQYVLESVLGQPGVKVLALCDIKPDRLDKAATVAGRDKPNTYTDYRKLLERKDVDAVFICTPCDLHVEMSIAALKANKHVYCEKPIGITAESIRELVRVARASKTVFQVGQQMRSEPRLRKTIEKIHEGGFGKIVMVRAQRHSGDDLDHDGSSADWFFNAARSGDVLVEMSVHNLDVCNWVIAGYPERAAGFGGTLVYVNDPPGRTNMDGYTLSYEYPNGAKLSYIQTFFHPNGMPGGGQFFHVYTTEGGVDLLTATYYPRAKGAKPVVLVPPEPPERREMAHVAAFYEAIRTGKQPFADIAVGASGALTAIMGREAIYKKKVTTWREMGVEL